MKFYTYYEGKLGCPINHFKFYNFKTDGKIKCNSNSDIYTVVLNLSNDKKYTIKNFFNDYFNIENKNIDEEGFINIRYIYIMMIKYFLYLLNTIVLKNVYYLIKKFLII